MAAECARIEAAIPPRSKLIVLDERGQDWTSVRLASEMKTWLEKRRRHLPGDRRRRRPPRHQTTRDVLLRLRADPAIIRHGARAASRTALPRGVDPEQSSVSSRVKIWRVLHILAVLRQYRSGESKCNKLVL